MLVEGVLLRKAKAARDCKALQPFRQLQAGTVGLE